MQKMCGLQILVQMKNNTAVESFFQNYSCIYTWLSMCTIAHLSRKKWKFMFTKNLYTNVHRNFIHNSLRLETIQMSISWLMVRQIWYIPSCTTHRIRFNNRQEQATDTCNNSDRSQRNCTEEKANPKCHKLFYSIYGKLLNGKIIEMENALVIARY